ncbi:Na+/H+ antiporter subunit D [Nonomuraea cavernae]|uniref:Na+/H+ antiporter subunit D n=1 Tax=Nonomuraea cavernae TaxID=2045107 RepID=A0A918DGR8_9ACTN|nr:Na+/H+ antiporter subunit D [Nonomuraea cavernae]MCA2184293.1 Na+/H+ antiporter subunit D [Nonomuraea cavernae]GGO64243.1 Na+/H+ antiporter subunit D [Nonomuraea cavernae]
MEALVSLPVLLPLLAAGLKLAIGARLRRLQSLISIGTLGGVLVVSVLLLIEADTNGPLVTDLGGWPAPVGICLVADRLSTLMLVVSSAVTLCVMIYAVTSAYADQELTAPMGIFHPAFLVMVAGVTDAFLTGDLFNLFVAFEMLLSGSYVLLTFGGTQSRIRAGATYTVMALASSMLFLVALAVTYAATGTLAIAQLAERFPTLPMHVRLLIELTLLLVFAIKAAMFPLSAWLPDSYPTAPTPATAVFAGLLTKVGVYSVIRLEALLFPGGPVSTLLMWVALATMLTGVFGAVAQTDIKRMLSFTLVSHIGYMVFGVALSTVQGLTGAIFYVVHHITVQTSLFLVTGLIERRTGTTSVDRLGGLMTAAPLIAVLFFVPAMNLSGIPPMSGFLGKLVLVQAGVADGTPLALTLVAGGLVTSLLTLYAMVKTWGKAFWREPPAEHPGLVMESEEATGEAPIVTTAAMPVLLLGSSAALVALALSFTVLAGPLSSLAERAAGELMAREPYISAVLGRTISGGGS